MSLDCLMHRAGAARTQILSKQVDCAVLMCITKCYLQSSWPMPGRRPCQSADMGVQSPAYCGKACFCLLSGRWYALGDRRVMCGGGERELSLSSGLAGTPWLIEAVFR